MKNEVYDLTSPQKSILFTEQFYKGSSVNNICGTAIIHTNLNFDVLKKAVNIFVHNNDSFQLRLVLVDNEMKQYKVDFEPFDVEIVDLNSENELHILESKMYSTPFDVFNNTCLYDVKLFRYKDNSGGFVFNVHHLIGDSWALGIVAREVVRIYSCLLEGIPTPKNEDFSYINYIHSETEYVNSSKFQKDKDYWNNIFKTIPEPASIPSTSVNTTNDFSCLGKRNSFTIQKNIMEQITAYCKLNNISVFNFFMAVYSLYIGRVSNLNDFVIGTPILNRSNFKEKNTTGMFINIAPLRINIDNTQDFKSFAHTIAKDSMSMLRHQKYSYQYILEDLRKRDISLPNLYNIVLSYQITSAVDNIGIPYETTWSFNGNCSDDIDIHIYDLNNCGNIIVAYDYKTSKYTNMDIENIHNRAMHMVEQILNNNNICLNNIDIVTMKEKNELLHTFNNTNLKYDNTKTVISFFEEQVKKTPNATALTFEGKQMSYTVLNEKANSLAHELKNNGITNNSIIGVMVNRSFEMIISILAVLKAGGAYIPIDPEYPLDRINYMLQDSKASLLLTTKNVESIVDCNKIIYVDLDSSIYNTNKNNLESISNPDDLSYIIYTSGSTGKPKGVMLTQKSLCNFYYAMLDKIEYLQNGKNFSIVSITTVSFDIFAFETLISLTNGLNVYITNYNEQKMTDKLENLIAQNNIDIIQTTPSVMRFHLDNLTNTKSFSNLKYVMLAGEQLPKILVDRIKQIAPKCTIYNGYGPSETTIFSSVQNATNLEQINIGKPIANTQIYILDNNMNLLPKHHVGEIYISGDGVGKGYLYKHELTNLSFLPNPFNTNSLLYKTGDLGLWLDDGCIECKGRIDHQVKLHGLRIELGEIENKINSYSKDNSLKSAVIIKYENNKDYLCAFIETPSSIDVSSLKAYLLKLLPNYMVPTYFTQIDKLPQTPNGKTDRKALLNYNVHVIEKALIKPNTTTENTLYNLVASITNNSEFSMTDDLFTLGMDSLNIISLSSKILKEFNVEVSIKNMYATTSLIDLAKLIDKGNEGTTNTFSICVAPQNDSYPLSEEQLSIFYATTMSNSNSLIYNVSGGIIIEDILSREKVENCFKKIIQKHASFRTIFKFMDQEPRQIVLDSVPFYVEEFFGTPSEIEKIVSTYPKPFSLDCAPLLRVSICHLGNNTLLLLDSHHIIMDGFSLQLLVNDFNLLYNNKHLPTPKWRYIDFAYSEKNYLNSPNVNINKEYWINKFKRKEIPVISLPYDYSPITVSDSGNSIELTFDEQTFCNIKLVAKQAGVSTHIVFLTAFYLLLHEYTSQNNIIVGIPLANRTLDSVQNIIGMFVNNSVLDITIDSNNTFMELLDCIKAELIESMEHQPYPYHTLVKNLSLNEKNLFDVMFVYQSEYTTNFHYANTHTSKFNLSCEILPYTRSIKLEYRTDLFKHNTINRLLTHYKYILENILELTTCKICNCNILLPKDKNKILNEFNDTTIKYNNTDLIKTIEGNAINSPNNIAVIFEGESLTYNELNEKATRLAQYLTSLNIEQNNVISILLNRSFDLVIAICAVLKCGASYVLIDPSFPQERINYIIKDSHSKYCITTTNKSSSINIKCILIDNFDFCSKTDNVFTNTITDNLCIIYTSGSTGNPKGVILHKHGFINLLYAFDHEMNISKYSNILGIATVSFDMFAVELFSALFFGNTLILANEEEQKNVISMSKLIKQYKVDFFVTTPSRVELLLLDECENPLKEVKAFQLGGEKLSPILYEKLQLMTNAKIFNGYGPTEITACCSNKLVTSTDITIGKPISNVQIYICNVNMNLCPIGVTGEICVAGFGVAKGYLNKPDATAKNFIKNPFGDGLLYKTGDLGKYRENGEIEYIGRSDFQIKIRGLRIELSEIENKLNNLSSIEQSSVLYKNNCKTPYLIAFVVSKVELNVHDIKTELSKALPTYMIPRYIIQLDTLPITINGKVDRKALENYNLPTEITEPRNTYTPPKTAKQKLFCDIWTSLLNVDIGIDDDLFDIGADSLLAIKFKIKLLSHNIDLPYANIFKYRTIRELCNCNSTEITKSDSLNDYNYIPIQKLLTTNVKSICTYSDSTNVLLLGGTGFVGMHIIDSFIKHTTGKIYCIVRDKNKTSAITRFMEILHFYFGNSLDSLIDSRIFIIKGNILKENFGLSNQVYQNLVDEVDVIINSAANVKHYGSSEKFKNINVDTTQNAINFCLKNKKRFIHISSLSISGNMVIDSHLANINNFSQKTFSERDLFIGQTLDNVYSRSKFEAERIILDSIINNKLNAQILRLGNITSRYSDGLFQINPEDNAFANRLKTFLQLNMFPEYLLHNYVEFTPVDLCADAIINIINNNCPNTYIYHVYNNNHVYFSELLQYLKELKFNMNIISEEDFKQKINDTISNNSSSNDISGIINDFNIEKKLDYSSHIQITNYDSNEFLNKCKFHWPNIDANYIKKYISYLQKIKFIS